MTHHCDSLLYQECPCKHSTLPRIVLVGAVTFSTLAVWTCFKQLLCILLPHQLLLLLQLQPGPAAAFPDWQTILMSDRPGIVSEASPLSSEARELLVLLLPPPHPAQETATDGPSAERLPLSPAVLEGSGRSPNSTTHLLYPVNFETLYCLLFLYMWAFVLDRSLCDIWSFCLLGERSWRNWWSSVQESTLVPGVILSWRGAWANGAVKVTQSVDLSVTFQFEIRGRSWLRPCPPCPVESSTFL